MVHIYTIRINKISDCELKLPPSPQPTPRGRKHNQHISHCFFCNTARPTEVPEFDVYICESKYHELEHSIKRLGKGLKVSDSPASSHTISLSLSLPPILSLSLSLSLRSQERRGKREIYTFRYTVITRMTPALRWAAVRAILMFH